LSCLKSLRKIFIWLGGIIAGLYLLICAGMYSLQEKIIFHPAPLAPDFRFSASQPFEEISIPAADGSKLSGLLLKCDSARGLVFYLHGNSGTLATWAGIGKNYAALGYDVFIMDYRGFGKSEGEISSEEQFYGDVKYAYAEMKKRYDENRIVVIGYSIGTASAAMLAAGNQPKMLILQAPYYSLTDMMDQRYSFLPGFLLKYKFETYSFLEKVKAPVRIFHGDADEIIYYGASLKLKNHLKAIDKLIMLPGAGHLGLNDNLVYLQEIARELK
jgi:uncharacterized protein